MTKKVKAANLSSYGENHTFLYGMKGIYGIFSSPGWLVQTGISQGIIIQRILFALGHRYLYGYKDVKVGIAQLIITSFGVWFGKRFFGTGNTYEAMALLYANLRTSVMATVVRTTVFHHRGFLQGVKVIMETRRSSINTRAGIKRTKTSPIADLPPIKSQLFKKVRPDAGSKKMSPDKDQILWGVRAGAYKEKYGRHFGTDSEGQNSDETETARLMKNLRIPKKGQEFKDQGVEEAEENLLFEKITSGKPKTTEELFDALAGLFRLTNKNISSTRTILQQQVDTVGAGVRTNTRAIIRSRKELLAVTDRVLNLERKSLANSILVYDHGMGIGLLKKWQEREKTVNILLQQALGITSELDYLFKVVKTEAQIPRNQAPGQKPPPIKVFFPSTAAYEYLATVIQYPTKLRKWHLDEQGKRGSLPRFSVKPNITYVDRQRAQYCRQVVENIKAAGVPSGIQYEVTPYRGIRKLEDGNSSTVQFERALQIYANFLPVEDRQSTTEQGAESGLRQADTEINGSESQQQGSLATVNQPHENPEDEMEETYMSA